MRFTLQLPTDRVSLGAEYGSAAAVMEMARAAEDHGFDAVHVTEHPIPSDAWMGSGGHHALDPFVALAFAAAATTRLRLQTHLCVVPYRNPFLTAKAVATLDSLSGGRVIFGAGAGYLEAEFRALGVDYAARNELFDEALVVMKQAWTGESLHAEGHGFSAQGHHALPRPAQRPHPPIWIGGNSRRAIRRAVDHGDGWMPIPNPARLAERRRTPGLETLDDLRARLGVLRAYAAERARPVPRDVMFMPIGRSMYDRGEPDPGAEAAQIAELAELGVTYIGVGFPVDSRREFLSRVERYAREVAARVGAG
jgi:probable F420-dependent oxidoreductase